ncbi:hypothetical protein AVEN_78157-1 [Araneus ventricosus]|uniref:Uncharacterized protein n=1 Tax=Araneus ventricosus TaxID=182803 RepID=A0A4Y2MS09_ARAVE|nr:hypothetical protein AVEN_78157-1 [Araneus ventricosus]
MNTGCLDKLKEMVEAEFQANFEAQREELRKHAKQQIFKIQEENRKTYNLRRREPKSYRVGDLVAIKRTQFGPNLKLKPNVVWRTSRIQEGRDCGARLTAAHVIPAAPLADLRRTGQLTI